MLCIYVYIYIYIYTLLFYYSTMLLCDYAMCYYVIINVVQLCIFVNHEK